MNLALDCLVLDDQSHQNEQQKQASQFKFKTSLNNFELRQKERAILKARFFATGGRYIERQGAEDPELSEFISGIACTEMSRKLIVSLEKDFSDKKFDIKIYEVKLVDLGKEEL